MKTAQPIRKKEEVKKIKEYYQKIKPRIRNYLLVTIALNTALRISDILSLRWKHVYDMQTNQYRSHIDLREQKTGKQTKIKINTEVLLALKAYEKVMEEKYGGMMEETFLFRHANKNSAISRVQAHRIVKCAGLHCDIPHEISCHSLRKTFGYMAWKQGISPALLVDIYNHSSYEVTKRYLGIEQEERDEVFECVLL